MLRYAIKSLLSFFSAFFLPFNASSNVVFPWEKYVEVRIDTSIKENKVKATSMLQVRKDAHIFPFQYRFDYLIVNYCSMYKPEKKELIKQIHALYPDTIRMRQMYFQTLQEDEKFTVLFSSAVHALNKNVQATIAYSEQEMMQMASRFFYCHAVVSNRFLCHVCTGINGIKDLHDFERPYLEAFCIEAILKKLEHKDAKFYKEFGNIIKKVETLYLSKNLSREESLDFVKVDIMNEMKQNKNLKKVLLAHYNKNKHNLAFYLQVKN